MLKSLALSVPRTSPTISHYRIACLDVMAGLCAVDIWGRLGWRETKRRYRRTAFGPFWTTISLAIFVITLGLVWSNLWNKNPKVYLPYLTSGMLCWMFFVATCTEGAGSSGTYEKIIKQLRVSYTMLACAVVWRNTTVLFHNSIFYALIYVYAGISITWASFLIVPGFALFFLNMTWIVLVLGCATARYRDLQQLVGSLLQVSLFLTPIFWSPDQLSGRMAVLVQLNPLYHLIAIVRAPLLGQAPTALNWTAAAIIAMVGWAFTILMLAKLRHRIVYWL